MEHHDTIDELKRMIERMEGTSPANQNLKFAGRPLERGTLSDYNIQKESIIHMVQRFPGGGWGTEEGWVTIKSSG
jgi:Ubiquitin family